MIPPLFFYVSILYLKQEQMCNVFYETRKEAVRMALSEMQERFCQFYVGECRGNGTEAVVRAGYTENRSSTAVIASQNLRKLNIISRIKDLRREALEASGFDKERVREAIMRRMMGIVSTSLTDIVHISPSRDDPHRREILKELAEKNGGQQILDFGELLFVPTTGLTDEADGAIKKFKAIQPTEHSDGGLEVEMHDPIAAARLLAEISGLKQPDTEVNVNVSPAVILQQVEARKAGASANG